MEGAAGRRVTRAPRLEYGNTEMLDYLAGIAMDIVRRSNYQLHPWPIVRLILYLVCIEVFSLSWHDTQCMAG